MFLIQQENSTTDPPNATEFIQKGSVAFGVNLKRICTFCKRFEPPAALVKPQNLFKKRRLAKHQAGAARPLVKHSGREGRLNLNLHQTFLGAANHFVMLGVDPKNHESIIDK